MLNFVKIIPIVDSRDPVLKVLGELAEKQFN